MPFEMYRMIRFMQISVATSSLFILSNKFCQERLTKLLLPGFTKMSLTQLLPRRERYTGQAGARMSSVHTLVTPLPSEGNIG